MLIEAKTVCSCKWVKCKRHGNCTECIEHHKNHKKYPLPFCQRQQKEKAEKETKLC